MFFSVFVLLLVVLFFSSCSSSVLFFFNIIFFNVLLSLQYVKYYLAVFMTISTCNNYHQGYAQPISVLRTRPSTLNDNFYSVKSDVKLFSRTLLFLQIDQNGKVSGTMNCSSQFGEPDKHFHLILQFKIVLRQKLKDFGWVRNDTANSTTALYLVVIAVYALWFEERIKQIHWEGISWSVLRQYPSFPAHIKTNVSQYLYVCRSSSKSKHPEVSSLCLSSLWPRCHRDLIFPR